MLYLLVSIRFQVLFHSPPGVLFTVPSQYYSLSVTRSYLALRDGPRIFPQNSSCSVVLWILTAVFVFRLRECHPLCLSFPEDSSILSSLDVSPLPLGISLYQGLGSYHFARHYFGNHCFIFFSSGYLDVSVPRVPSTILCIHIAVHTPRCVGSPIRISTDLRSFATPRSFSQLVTSFFGA